MTNIKRQQARRYWSKRARWLYTLEEIAVELMVEFRRVG